MPTKPTPTIEVHPPGWLDSEAADFHGEFIKTSDWDLKKCQQCHGTEYNGAIAETSCLTCHPKTPEDCVVCHGSVDNRTGAPPRDLQGNSMTDSRGVGAHTAHLSEGQVSLAFGCETCHIVPDSLYAEGHLDSSLYAEVRFSGLATEGGANAQWNGQSCQNSYCHGNFQNGNSNNSPMWTVVNGTQAACGTCHGLPPGGNHPSDTQCSLCHPAVVDANNSIIAPQNHINGEVAVDFSQHDRFAFPIFSGEHKNKWQNDCSICHTEPANKKIFSCFNCHKHRKDEMDKEHKDKPGYTYDSNACYSCHPDGKEPNNDD